MFFLQYVLGMVLCNGIPVVLSMFEKHHVRYIIMQFIAQFPEVIQWHKSY